MPRIQQIFSAGFFVVAVANALIWQIFSSRYLWAYAAPLDHPTPNANVFGSSRVSPDEHDIEAFIVGPLSNATKQANFARAPPSAHTLTVVAVGDLHGDLTSALAVLQMADVVDIKGKWTGDIDILIQTGDIIDRGDDTILLFHYFNSLRAQAEAVGGKVISLLGNHEYWNVLPNWKYVADSELASFSSWEDRWKAITTGDIGTSWKNHYKVACRLPLHPSIGSTNADYDGKKTSPLSHAAISFVHGGLSPKYPDMTPFPSRINEIGLATLKKLQSLDWSQMSEAHRKLLNDKAFRKRFFGVVMQHQLKQLSPEELELLNDNSPLEYRGWANPDLDDKDPELCRQVDEVLEKTGTMMMVMGHTTQLNHQGIMERCDGKIFVIDTGISSVYSSAGGMKSAIRIDYSLTPKTGFAGSSDKQVWKERIVVTEINDEMSDDIRNSEREITGNFADPSQ